MLQQTSPPPPVPSTTARPPPPPPTQNSENAAARLSYIPAHYERGCPVFRPRYQEFVDFRQYITIISRIGFQHGLMKIIPPKEWIEQLPEVDARLDTLRLSGIRQAFVGERGIYRMINTPMRNKGKEEGNGYSVKEWWEKSLAMQHRPPMLNLETADECDTDGKMGDHVMEKAASANTPNTSTSAGRKRRQTQADALLSRHIKRATLTTPPGASSPSPPPMRSCPNPSLPSSTQNRAQAHVPILPYKLLASHRRQKGVETESMRARLSASTEGLQAGNPVGMPNQNVVVPCCPADVGQGKDETPGEVRATKAAKRGRAVAGEGRRKGPRRKERKFQNGGGTQREKRAGRPLRYLDCSHLLKRRLDLYTDGYGTLNLSERECGQMEAAYWHASHPSLALSRPIYSVDNPGSLTGPLSPMTWNMNHLDDLLAGLEYELPGINKPYVYFGSWGATFPWHTEDLDLYSINFLHFGAPKLWYVVSSAEAARFESLATSFYPTAHRKCPEFLRHKIAVIRPDILQRHCITVKSMIQRKHEMIITLPRAYHSGFNMGFNCAESVNFAVGNWIRFGLKAGVCQCVDTSLSIDGYWREILEKEMRKKEDLGMLCD